MRVLVTERQTLFRSGLRSLLEARGHSVVAEARRGREAIALAWRWRPDLVLMGVSRHDGEELEAATRLRRQLPWIKVILLAAFAEADLEAAAITGAHGFVGASLPSGEFFALVEAVSRGAARVIAPRRAVPHDRSPIASNLAGPEALTARELDVLHLLAEGVTTNRELAARLQVSENTVRYHVRNVLTKLCLDNRAQAVAAAVRNDLGRRA